MNSGLIPIRKLMGNCHICRGTWPAGSGAVESTDGCDPRKAFLKAIKALIQGLIRPIKSLISPFKGPYKAHTMPYIRPFRKAQKGPRILYKVLAAVSYNAHKPSHSIEAPV